MAEYPALDLRFALGPGAGALQDLLYAELDAFEPTAIENHDAGDGWRVFFRTSSQRDAAARALVTALGSHVLDVAPVQVDDEDWARRSQAALTAVRAGCIVVAPPWDVPHFRVPGSGGNRNPGPGPRNPGHDIVIVIEPSMGFGTGHHETTRLCLELLQGIDLHGRRVLDVGTGSGVLAIAAARLGASAVIAIDNDPDAADNARANIRTNDVEQQILLRVADLNEVSDAADVLLANLTGVVLAARAGHLRTLVKQDGVAILSGFAPDEIDAVSSAWSGWSVREEKRAGDWAALMLGR